MVSRLEALMYGIASVRGWNNPESRAFTLMNPMLVKSFSRPGKNDIDGEDGVRVFKSSLAGIRANLFDLMCKCSGESRAGIKKDDLLENVLRVYGIVELGGQQTVVKFLKRALQEEDITKTTPLEWFLADMPKEEK